MVTVALIDHAALLIVPLIPIAFLLALAGGAFAIFKKKGSKSAPGIELPPGVTGEAPYMSLRQQQPGLLVQAKLTKPSEAWSWTVSNGTSGVASTAAEGALAMVAAFRTAGGTGFASAPVMGLIGGGGAPTLAFDAGNGEDRPWTITSSAPATPGQLPKPPTLVASGSSPAFLTAIMAIMTALSQLVPWLGYTGDKTSAPAPTNPNDIHFNADDPQIKSYHGLVISPSAVAVKNLTEWQDFIAPHIVALLKVTADADAIMDDVLGRNMPDNAKLNGRNVSGIRANVQDTIDKIKNGTWISVGSPDRVLAAQLVGSGSNYKPEGFAYQYKGYSVVVRKIGATTYEYAIWKGARGLDTAIMDRGEKSTKNQAIKAARARIDSGFHDVPENPGPQTGAPPKAPPPPDQCKTIAHTWSGQQTTPSRNYTQSKITTTETIFAPYGSCDSFVMRVGVCLYAIKGSLGKLSSALGSPASSSMHISQFGIFQGSDQPAAGQFMDELCWKRQFEAKIHRAGGTIVLDSFNTVDPVDELDSCPTRKHHWPEGDFVVVGTDHEQYAWNPKITYTAQVKGNKLELSIATVGLPHFVQTEKWPKSGWGVVPRTFFADLITNTTYRIAFKGWSIGV